mgnify:CR=1 FL=1
MSTFTGKFFTPADSGFDEAAVGRVFNHRRPTRRPNAVLLAETRNDIVNGVKYAKEQGWGVAVRAGGHSWAAWSVRENTLLIDLGLYQEMDYDPETGIASATPAVKGGEVLDPYLQSVGRFFNGGHCPTVGIGGFLLQGGQGWVARGWGWAAERVVAVDVVTADGELVRADATQNQDLYWAARGAGPSFPGVVTRFYLQTMPRYKHAVESVQLYRPEQFQDLLKWLYSIHDTVSPDVEIVLVSQCGPTGPNGEIERTIVIDALTLVDDVEQGKKNLEPFKTFPGIDTAIVNIWGEETLLANRREQQLLANPEGHRYFVDNIWVEGEPATIAEKLDPLFTQIPEQKGFTIWYSMGPIRELPDMAFSMQSPGYVATYLVSDDESRDAQNRAWLDGAMANARPVTKGTYLGDSDFGNRQLKFMSPENYGRLQKVIADRDPSGLFVRYLTKDATKLNTNDWE